MTIKTLQKRTKIANDIMYYIYQYIDTDINLDLISNDLKISKFHMHRVFKEIFQKNIYESIKSIRLQKAANLLLTNKYSTITQIANMCGYSSQTSFIRAFKQRFNSTPTQWRVGGYKLYSSNILQKKHHKDFDIEPQIVKMPELTSYYIRHNGYDKSIKKTWQKLYTWILANDIKHYTQIGLHHDNPIITPLNDCQYVAAIVLEDFPKEIPLPTFTIPGGVYAKFELCGEYGDILDFLQWVYHNWLENSGFETTPLPPYTIYKKNHFLNPDGTFDLEFYLPINFSIFTTL
jgi:AraC family transcriptional regulator